MTTCRADCRPFIRSPSQMYSAEIPYPRPISITSRTRRTGGTRSGQGVVGADVLLGQLLDVHVAGRHHPHATHEPRRPVHVPHPRVGELDLEPRSAGPVV